MNLVDFTVIVCELFSLDSVVIDVGTTFVTSHIRFNDHTSVLCYLGKECNPTTNPNVIFLHCLVNKTKKAIFCMISQS